MSDAVTDSGHVIFDRIPQGVDPRKHIPLSVKVSVLLRMLGLQEGDINWDHRPPLRLPSIARRPNGPPTSTYFRDASHEQRSTRVRQPDLG